MGIPKSLAAIALPPPFPIISFIIINNRPTVRGSVTVRSTDPYANPSLDYGWNEKFKDSEDLEKLISVAKQIRDLMKRLEPEVIKYEVWPGDTFTKELEKEYPDWELLSEEEKLKIADIYHLKRNIHPVFHLTGSCRMGEDGEDESDSCTDTHGRVRGVSGLSVCDNSILPIIPDANPTATLLAVCAKIADYHIEHADVCSLS